MATETLRKASPWRRVLWFVAIYAASVVAVGAVVYGLRAAFGGLLS